MTKIYIVRHTQTIGNIEKRLTGRCDYELTEEGKKYVEYLTDRFKGVKIDKIYSSTSGRAIKTVLPIANMNNIKIIENEDLLEMYFGIYDGWKWEEVNKVNPKIHELQVKTNEIMTIPKQETMNEVADRMYNCIYKIAKENENKTIMIASHGVAIEAFLRRITGEPFSIKREQYSQKNTCVNELEFDFATNKFKILKLNDISHLESTK